MCGLTVPEDIKAKAWSEKREASVPVRKQTEHISPHTGGREKEQEVVHDRKSQTFPWIVSKL